MMSRFRVVMAATAALLLFCLVIGGCSGRETRDPERYYDDERGFSVLFPDEWMLKKGDGENDPFIEATSAWENDLDEFSEYVTVDVERLPSKMSLEEYFESSLQEQILNLPNFSEIDRAEARLGEIEARYVLFDVDFPEGRNRILGYAMVNEDRGYLLTFVAEAKKYGQYETVFKEIAESFRFE